MPVNDFNSMRDTLIKIDWAAITQTIDIGASPITSYSLEWDQATGTWTPLFGFATASLALTWTQSSGLVAGQSYSFRLRAKNANGWGPYSNTLVVVPSWTPSAPA
jgi:hypothetical protein